MVFAMRPTPFQAKLPTPFALLGIRAADDALDEIVFLPRSGASLAPQNGVVERVCAQIGLGGFAHQEGGFHLSVKRWLLAHEGAGRR